MQLNWKTGQETLSGEALDSRQGIRSCNSRSMNGRKENKKTVRMSCIRTAFDSVRPVSPFLAQPLTLLLIGGTLREVPLFACPARR